MIARNVLGFLFSVYQKFCVYVSDNEWFDT